MARHSLAIIFGLLAAPALACPAAPDRSEELAALFDAARAAPNEMAAQGLSSQMWEIWTDAPDEIAQAMLARGMSARQVGDFLGAQAAFDDLVTYCPDYAEGYNQRAFMHFLSGAFDPALSDLLRTVQINPEHVGALSGLALTLNALGREDEAQEWLKAALALNPWIPERGLLKEPPGEEL